MKRFVFFLLTLCTMAGAAQADRIKDLASVAAGRSNQLIGYGLVVGLQGTGPARLCARARKLDVRIK